MPIVMQRIANRRMGPVFRCDLCGEVIDGEGKGNVVLRLRDAEATVEGSDIPYYVVHKGACDKRFEASLPDGRRGYSWMPIGFFIARLCHNAGIDVPAEAALMADIGGTL
jgi:hypothetical protein